MIFPFFKTKKNETYWQNRQIDWKTSYFDTINHPHRDRIIEVLKTINIKSALEIGCGAGENLWRIKKAFPYVQVAGCDINSDAITEAKKQFTKDFPGKQKDLSSQIEYREHPIRQEQKELAGGVFYRSIPLPDIEFRVGKADALPFNGDSFDLVLTDAMLIYIGPDKIRRVLREIRRVGYNKMIFIEFHSKSWWKRLRMRLASRYFAYNYEKLLKEAHFKHIAFHKIPKEIWGFPWSEFGYIITAIR